MCVIWSRLAAGGHVRQVTVMRDRCCASTDRLLAWLAVGLIGRSAGRLAGAGVQLQIAQSGVSYCPTGWLVGWSAGWLVLVV